MGDRVRHLLSLADLEPGAVERLVEDAVEIGSGRRGGRPLEGKAVGIYFKKTSTRTRTAFTVGAHRLGATTIAYGPNDLQINTGETHRDTGCVLSQFLDVLVARTNESMADMRELAAQGRMAVVNAMSAEEHPSQVIGDLATLAERFGRLDGLHVLYLGEGNNTASALAFGVAACKGMRLTIATPEGYGLHGDVLGSAQRIAARTGAAVEQVHGTERLPSGVDAVYTARWMTLGVPKADAGWLEHFRRYAVTAELMARVGRPTGTIFMHDLPAVRGVDTMDDVLDGPQSVALRQAYYKMPGAMAVLAWCVAG